MFFFFVEIILMLKRYEMTFLVKSMPIHALTVSILLWLRTHILWFGLEVAHHYQNVLSKVFFSRSVFLIFFYSLFLEF